jgi:hypothetical protein
MLARFGLARLSAAFRARRGWWRLAAGVFLVGLVVLGGALGILVSLLLVAAAMSSRATNRVNRWRLRPVARYVTEIEETHETVEQQLVWLHREVERRDAHITELQRELAQRDGLMGDVPGRRGPAPGGDDA